MFVGGPYTAGMLNFFCTFLEISHHLPDKVTNEKRHPLGVAFVGDLIGTRTRVYAVRGRRLNRLTIRPSLFYFVVLVPYRASAVSRKRELSAGRRSARTNPSLRRKRASS